MKKEKWYFTFGSGQLHEGRYVCISGTYDEARQDMVLTYGFKWCWQYSEKEFEGQPEKYGITELK